MEMIQLWRPDTCGCEVHQAVDDVTRVIRFVPRTEAVFIHIARYAARPESTNHPDLKPQPEARQCIHHVALGNTLAHYNVVKGENNRKNIVLDMLRSVKSDLTDEQYLWTFLDETNADMTRKLQVTAPLTSQQKTQVGNAVNLQFGPDVVRVI